MIDDFEDSTPSPDRERSYSGGYMKVGRAGEEVCIEVLKADTSFDIFEDLRLDLDFQSRGIDVRLRKKADGRWITFEIKTDNHLDVSGRWLFELYRIYLTVPVFNAFVVGWSVKAEAEWLIFFAPSTRRLHFIRMDEYRAAHIAAAADGKCHYQLIATDRIKRTLNAYFPEEYIARMQSYRVFSLPKIEDG